MTDKIKYVGIDPGQGGAVCHMNASGRVLSVQSLPKLGYSYGVSLDDQTKPMWLPEIEGARVMMEDLSGMVAISLGGNPLSLFSNGLNMGILISAYKKNDIYTVRPADWKKEFKVSVKTDSATQRKARAVAAAMKIDGAIPFLQGSTSSDHDKAEAILLAEYARLKDKEGTLEQIQAKHARTMEARHKRKKAAAKKKREQKKESTRLAELALAESVERGSAVEEEKKQFTEDEIPPKL